MASTLFASSLVALSSGCSSIEPLDAHPATKGGPVTSVFVVPASLDVLRDETFFDQPWPSDLRLEQGSPRFEGWYNPRGIAILDEYIGAMKGVLDGFSPAAAGFVRFSGALDPASLPADPKAATAKDASVQLVDIDPASPEHGKRRLVSLELHEDEGVYWRAHTLAFMPTIGFPLRPHTRYAFVVTDAVRAKDGSAVEPSFDLEEALGEREPTRPETQAARDALAPAVAEIEAAGVAKEHVVQLAVFTTDDPTALMVAARDDLVANAPAPAMHPDAWKLNGSSVDDDEYVGMYGPSPNYQAGTIPYAKYGDGGAFAMKDGHPTPANLFDLRFSLLVPNATKCPMPPDGYPIVLYAHGTGGDYRSYMHDGTGHALAKRCIATMGIDQIFHGTRPGAPPDGDESKIELLFFNFQNVVAIRHNTLQAALDEVQRARLFTVTHATVPASVSVTKSEIAFDASRLMFFGHSQGGLNGPLYLATDDSARGGVLSGSSAMISIALREKTQPSPSVANLVKSIFLGLDASEADEVTPFHPALALAQTIADQVDPIHYARLDDAEPRAGFSPKSIYMTEGINADGTGDNYAPPHGIEAQAIAIGLPLQAPGTHPIAESAFGGPQPVTVPKDGLSGDLAGGNASGVLAQWAVPPGDDGHFVVFDVPAARDQAAQFLRNLADDPAGKVPAP